MKKNKFISLIMVFILVIVLIIALIIYQNSQKSMLLPMDPNDTTIITVEVIPGSSALEIATLLKENGLIRSEDFFLKFINSKDLSNLKSGVYSFTRSENMLTIAEKLNVGAPSGKKITIPEGYNIRIIAEKLIQEGIISDFDHFVVLSERKELFTNDFEFLNDEEIKTLEGYLFPDTYYFSEGSSSEQIYYAMINQFKSKVIDSGIIDKQNKMSLNDIITLASIVQRESGSIEEMPKVASVFLNRLNADMTLGSCSTVEYALGEKIEGKLRLNAQDIMVDSPYNTYVNKGLPPTPISCISMDSLNAVLNPEDTNYMYFVADTKGSNQFSVTYDEHLKKVKNIYGEY